MIGAVALLLGLGVYSLGWLYCCWGVEAERAVGGLFFGDLV